jgi:nucleotide-binding universal stress UspA family protein
VQKISVPVNECCVGTQREEDQQQRAAALGCDGIVMGTHGMTPLGSM